MPDVQLAYSATQINETIRSSLSDTVVSIADVRNVSPVDSDYVRVIGGAQYAWSDGSTSVEEEITSGSATGTTDRKLVDSAAKFINVGVLVGQVVNNTSTGASALVTSVDSQTQVSLSVDIFSTGESYQIGTTDEGRFLTSTVATYGVGEANEGRWLAQLAGTPVSVEWYGASDANSDNSPLIQAAINASETIEIVSDYDVKSPIKIPHGRPTSISGPGSLRATASMDAIFIDDNALSTTRVAGTASSVSAFELVDTTADFSQVLVGEVANNITTGLTARVDAIDLIEKKLTLSADIFTTIGDEYEVGIPSNDLKFDISGITLNCNGLANHGAHIGRSVNNYWSGVSIESPLQAHLEIKVRSGDAPGSTRGRYLGMYFAAAPALSGTVDFTIDNGSGEIRVSSVAHGLSTSDVVNVGGFATDEGGRYTVTVITANTFDLDGSTYTVNESGFWEKRQDYCVDIGALSDHNYFSACAFEGAGLAGLFSAAEVQVEGSRFYGGSQYGADVSAPASFSDCEFDTVRYGLKVSSSDVLVTGGSFARVATEDYDPNAMTAVQLGANVSRLDVVDARISSSVGTELDLNGFTLTDYVWRPLSALASPDAVVPWPTASAPVFAELARGVRSVNGQQPRWEFGRSLDAEGGGDTGSNLELWLYDNTGSNPQRMVLAVRGPTPQWDFELTARHLAPVYINDKTVLAGATIADGDATPDVSGGTMFTTANTAPTTITNFDGPENYQWFMLDIADVNTTVQNNANIVTKSGSDITNKGLRHFVYRPGDTRWEEVK